MGVSAAYTTQGVWCGGFLYFDEMGMLIYCRHCGNCLGMLCAGHLAVKHRGREIVADLPRSILCERCGWVWRPEGQGDDMPEAAKCH